MICNLISPFRQNFIFIILGSVTYFVTCFPAENCRIIHIFNPCNRICSVQQMRDHLFEIIHTCFALIELPCPFLKARLTRHSVCLTCKPYITVHTANPMPMVNQWNNQANSMSVTCCKQIIEIIQCIFIKNQLSIIIHACYICRCAVLPVINRNGIASGNITTHCFNRFHCIFTFPWRITGSLRIV